MNGTRCIDMCGETCFERNMERYMLPYEEEVERTESLGLVWSNKIKTDSLVVLETSGLFPVARYNRLAY